MFAQVIQDHLELKRRNAALEHEMPLERYMNDDPFENHPLFKTEEQARVEDTMDGQQSIEDEPTPLDWPIPRTRSSTRPTVIESAQPTASRPRTSRKSASDESLWIDARATSTGATRRLRDALLELVRLVRQRGESGLEEVVRARGARATRSAAARSAARRSASSRGRRRPRCRRSGCT